MSSLLWHPTSVGHFTVQRDGRGRITRSRLLPLGQSAGDDAQPLRSAGTFGQALADRLDAHLRGEPQDYRDLPLALEQTSAAAQRALAVLAQVPYGQTRTYLQLAHELGHGAARGAAAAMANNRWPLLLPCHRVRSESGAIGGFSGGDGPLTKALLLRAERADYGAEPHLASVDPKLGAHIQRLGAHGLREKPPASLFAALLRSIVYQQLSGKAAATIFERVRALYPDRLAHAPTESTAHSLDRQHAQHTQSLPDEALRLCGLSGNKLLAVRDLAAKSLDGTLPTLDACAQLSDEALIERITTVRGLGRWSVQMLLMLSFGRLDVLPSDDLGVRKGFAVLQARRGQSAPEPAAKERLEAHAERWRPYRSVASWYLWRLAAPQPEPQLTW